MAACVVFHFLTLGLFTLIRLGLQHGRMPRLRWDDPSAGRAIGFMFIPFYNLYWMFFMYRRLCDRVDEQRWMRGLPPSRLRGLVTGALICQLIPYANYVSLLILMPIFLGKMQASINELVRVTPYQHYAGGQAACRSQPYDAKPR